MHGVMPEPETVLRVIGEAVAKPETVLQPIHEVLPEPEAAQTIDPAMPKP